jgi:dolichol kinase
MAFLINLQDILVVLLGIFFMIFSIIIPKKMQQRNLISKYVARKLIHSIGGLAILFSLFLSIYALIIGVFLFIIFTILIWFSSPESQNRLFREIFNAVSEDDEIQAKHLEGPFLYTLSITIIFAIFVFFNLTCYLYFPISGILIMMYADTLASIIGKRYGQHKIKLKWMQKTRSLEGSITFFVVAFFCSFLILFLFGVMFYEKTSQTQISLESCFAISLIFSAITTILELISPSKFDDLIITVLGTSGTFLISMFIIF